MRTTQKIQRAFQYFTLAIPAAVLCTACIGEVPDDEAIEASDTSTVGSVEEALDCTNGQCGSDPDICPNKCNYNSCGVMCKGYSGAWQTCESSGWIPHQWVKQNPAISLPPAVQNALIAGGWSINGSTQYVCHLDPDLHIDGTDFEFYVVDRYQDIRCWNPTPGNYYRKRKAGEKHCSLGQHLEDWATGGFDAPALENGECAASVVSKMASLNLVPIMSDVDTDDCPTPRL